MEGCIVCNGEIGDYERAWKYVERADIVIAANGGSRHLVKMELTPDIIVGDFDSMDCDVRKGFSGSELYRFSERKHMTDAELALELAFERRCSFVTLLGAAGGRLDHTLGNISLAMKHPGRISLADGIFTLTAIDPSCPFCMHGEIGSLVSLIPIPAAQCVSTTGLEYPLMQEDLRLGTRGISNVLIEKEATVSITGGLLLIYMENSKFSQNQ